MFVLGQNVLMHTQAVVPTIELLTFIKRCSMQLAQPTFKRFDKLIIKELRNV